MSATPNQPGPPRLTRQQSVQRIQDNQQGLGLGLNCCTLPAAIAALIIASQSDYESSACNDGTTYTVDLVNFLYIAGGIQVGFAGLFIIGQCFKQEKCLQSMAGCVACLSAFYFAWAVIGLYMYDNQMSEECQSTDIALMILSWSIIDIAIRALACCCIVFFVCCAGMVAALGGPSPAPTQQREQDPLLSAV